MSITVPQQQPPRQPRQPPPPTAGGTWNSQLHPRGRGGKWIVSHGAGYGAAGPDQTTKQLQQRLQQLGFHVPADGQFGPATQDAVKAFQARYGLATSGGVDAATMEVLQNPPTQTLAQVQAGNRATRKAASAAARKTATATATAKATRRTTRVRASAGGRTGGRGGVPAGTNTTVIGPGHLGNGELRQGAGMTGVKNEAVANLQAALNQTGAKLAKDGRFGPRTEAAVRQLQQAHGLAVDGIVGPETKGLLIGLQASASKATRRASRSATKTTKKVAGQPATLRTKAPHARHSSRTAGSRMRIKPPAKGIATLKYSAEVPTKQPDLEEATIAFGYGGEPSRSIKDFREQEPAYDLPVWLPEQVRADTRDLTIQDGRPPYRPPLPGDTTIDDGRAVVELQAALTEAVTARQAAKDGREFARARAREQVLRTRLQEAWSDAARAASLAVRRALTALKPGESTAMGSFHVKRESGGRFELYGPGHKKVSSHSSATAAAAHLVRAKQGLPSAALSTLYSVEEASVYSEAKHPRGRGGKWVDVLGKLKSAETNKPFDLGGGFTGLKLSTGHYAAGNGTEHIHHEDPERVARVVGAHLDRQAAQQARGEEAVQGLSTDVAHEFTRDWALRGDPEGLPERSEAYQQVYAEDPKGYVRDVFSQQMTDATHREARQALAAAHTRVGHREAESGYPGGFAPHPGERPSNKAVATKRLRDLRKADTGGREFSVGRVGQSGHIVLSRSKERAQAERARTERIRAQVREEMK